MHVYICTTAFTFFSTKSQHDIHPHAHTHSLSFHFSPTTTFKTKLTNYFLNTVATIHALMHKTLSCIMNSWHIFVLANSCTEK